MKRFSLILTLFFVLLSAASAQIDVKRAGGWLESAFIEWDLYPDADMYNVYYKLSSSSEWTKIDRELIRNYGYYGRADVVGISTGSYDLKVVATQDESEIVGSATVRSGIIVEAHDRAGFAFMNDKIPGAYKADGTLKENAKVIYVDNSTFSSYQWVINKDNKGGTISLDGIQSIVNNDGVWKYMQYNNNVPVCIRVIGEINLTGFPKDKWESSAEGLQIKGNSKTQEMNLTIEGIGEDAAFNGFGILARTTCSVELRNIAVLNDADDNISLDTDNSYTWVHNVDLFYGNAGSDSDQAKGDGSLDVKGNSQYQTYSYNHFWDSGKSSLCGMTSESGPNYITYHHNWFDHSDSRHPRVRTMTVHVYNNYYDGIAKYGIGATTGSNVFVEANYFRNTNRPMMSSKQGTDATGDGTFTGEDGGMIKSFGNLFASCGKNFSYITANEVAGSAATAVSATSFDAYEASTRNEEVPSSFVTRAGGTSYSNFDTNADVMHQYTADRAVDVPAKVKSLAGRMNGGDLVYVFNNDVDDASYSVNTALKSLLTNYKTSLVSIASFSNTTEEPTTYTATFLDKDGGVFATIGYLTKLVYPETTPAAEEGYTFIGWSVARGTVMTENMEIHPQFSDGNNSSEEDNGRAIQTVKHWDFTSWSSATINAVKALNTTGVTWVDKGDNTDRYQNSAAIERGAIGVTEAEGLLFTSASKGITMSVGSKGNYIQTNAVLYIPVTAGEKIEVSFANTGSSNPERFLILNGTTSVGSHKGSGKASAIIDVTSEMISDGYITLQGWSVATPTNPTSPGEKAAFNYFYIKSTSEVGSLETPTFKFDENNCEIDKALESTWVYPELTNSSDNKNVTYSSSNEAVATIDTDGNITPIGIGSTTITASVAKSETYRAASASYTLVVTDSSKPSFTVTFAVDGSNYRVAEKQYTIIYPAENPSKDNYVFTGWDVAEGTELSSNMTVNAQFEAVKTYTVTFKNADGTDFKVMTEQTSVVYPTEKPSKSGFTFKGWSIAEGTILSDNISVEPTFEEKTEASKPEDIYDDVLYATAKNTFYTSNGFFTLESTTTSDISSKPVTCDNIKYTTSIKLESSTKISFTPKSASKVVIILSGATSIKYDGTATAVATADENNPGLYKLVLDANAANHTIQKSTTNTIICMYIVTDSTTTDMESVNAVNEVASVEYYSLTGVRSSKLVKGINIVRTTYTDGTITVTKILK